MNDREDLRKKLAANLSDYKKELEEENDKRKKNEKNNNDNEETLAKNLKLMTDWAEKTDKENQKLIRLNDKLKIEFKSQDSDHDLLMKQIVSQKQQESKLFVQHQKLKEQVDDL